MTIRKIIFNYYRLCTLFLASLFLFSQVNAAENPQREADIFVLKQQQWSVPRDAITVLSMPAISSAMKKLSAGREKKLILRYPGGEVGMLWASELKGWLVSLGLSSSHISIQAAGLKPDELELLIN